MKLPRRIPWLAVAALAVLIPACVGALAGCSAFDPDWQRVHPPAPKPWQRVMVADADATCRALHSQGVGVGRILACATWRTDGCTIYMQPAAPAWIVEHEERHCQGWTHP